jgi:1-aminocyclopropane-1-carboxylate deaminase/D-cysteine desulfhydrase-like pyridoxal-dependent ACC family enzyme
MGGNKPRKLSTSCPLPLHSAPALVSIGGVQSNHTRLVAATAAKIGMKCVVVQEGDSETDGAWFSRDRSDRRS